MKTSSRVSQGLALIISLLSAQPFCQSANLLFEFTFNDAGPTTQMTERSASDWALTFQNQDGTSANWHGALGSGVSGLPNDLSFDNSASTQMGTDGVGGRATVSGAEFPIVDSFTLSGWFKTSQRSIGNFARLFFWAPENQIYSYIDGSLWLSVEANGAWSPPAYIETNQWLFFAVVYDGTQTENNVVFYKGTVTSSVTALSTNTLNQGSFNVASPSFAIGNNLVYSRPIQPFDGWLDNFRMYGGNGTDGIVDLQTLEALRAGDVAGRLSPIRIRTYLEWEPWASPNPSVMALSAWTIPGYRHQLQRSFDLRSWSDVPGALEGDGTRREWQAPVQPIPTFYQLEMTPTH